MKKKLSAAALALLLLFAASVTAFAASPALVFNSSYDADANLVTVSVCMKNPLGVEACDLELSYDTSMYEYNGIETAQAANATIVGGQSILDEGICTCSFVFLESCAEEDLDDDGNLQLATYTFKPLNDDYDVSSFYLWATSCDVEGEDLVDRIKPVGDDSLQRKDAAVVTVEATTKKSGSSDGGTKWYVYVIAVALAVGAIVGIAVIAVNKGKNDGDENNGNESAEHISDSDGALEDNSDSGNDADTSENNTPEN